MALWSYSDWVTLTDAAARLTRLRLHIQEVSEQTLATETPGLVKVSAVDPDYLGRLQTEERRLGDAADRAARAALGHLGRNLVSHRRWI